jgi:hypothetical protein
MRKCIKQKHAALAAMEQALSKALAQLALAQSTASLCGDALADELEDLIGRAIELRKNIARAEPFAVPANRCNSDNECS